VKSHSPRQRDIVAAIRILHVRYHALPHVDPERAHIVKLIRFLKTVAAI
jgi:hypothetical protein